MSQIGILVVACLAVIVCTAAVCFILRAPPIPMERLQQQMEEKMASLPPSALHRKPDDLPELPQAFLDRKPPIPKYAIAVRMAELKFPFSPVWAAAPDHDPDAYNVYVCYKGVTGAYFLRYSIKVNGIPVSVDILDQPNHAELIADALSAMERNFEDRIRQARA